MNIAPDLDNVLVAIADPTRRAILDRLARGPARVTDIAEPFTMSLAAVSKHVQMLERAGLVQRARRGREHTLTLNARPLRQVARWTARYERFWNERLDRLDAYFAQRPRPERGDGVKPAVGRPPSERGWGPASTNRRGQK